MTNQEVFKIEREEFVYKELNREEWQGLDFDDEEVRAMMERAYKAGYELALKQK